MKRAILDQTTFDEANGSLIDLNQRLGTKEGKAETVAAQRTPAAWFHWAHTGAIFDKEYTYESDIDTATGRV